MDEFVDFLKFSAPFFLAIFTFMAIVFGLVFVTSPYYCNARWEGTYKTKWGPVQGCRVNVNGKWFPEKNVREF